jgi:hypothetical protein
MKMAKLSDREQQFMKNVVVFFVSDRLEKLFSEVPRLVAGSRGSSD